MKNLLTGITLLTLLLAGSLLVNTARAQGTAFTYQGRLNTSGAPASGSYDMAFSLYATNVTGTPLGGPVTNYAVAVTNGLFTTLVDFGNVYNGASNWLQIAVSSNTLNAFNTLTPRQQLTPVPYALFATAASNLNGSLPATQLSGTIPLAVENPAVVTNDEGNLTLNGVFSGNGAGVTNIPLSSVGPAGTLSQQAEYFSPPYTYPTGNNPDTLAIVTNIDGHGTMALVTGNNLGDTLTILTNNGFGVFGYNSTVTAFSNIVSLVAGDINGDGSPDLVCVCSRVDLICLLTNNGAGVFSNSYNLVVPDVGNAVLADMNGDGSPDLVVQNELLNNGMLVYTNNGTGRFSLCSTNKIFSQGDIMAVTDFNGDGKPDVAYCAIDGGQVTIFTNNGGGVLSSNAVVYLPAISPAFAVAAVDIRGTGKPDLAFALAESGVLIFTNNGSGIYGTNSALPVQAANSLAVADVNGDGRPDLVVGSGNGGMVVYTNNGRGGFGYNTTLAPDVELNDVRTGDVNGDGQSDFVAASYYSNTVTVVFGYPDVLAFTNAVTFTDSANTFYGAFTGSGAGLTALNTTNLTGTIQLAQLSGITSNQLDAATWQLATNLNGGNAALATNVVAGINITNAYVTNSTFAGNGGNLTNLNASQLVSLGNLGGGSGNFFLGTAGNATVSGSFNTGLGLNAVQALTTGADVTALGSGALHADNTGADNTGIGFNALHVNTLSSQNTAVGSGALANVTVGYNNIGIGYNAGNAISVTSSNIMIGNTGLAGDNDVIRIGTQGIQSACYLAGSVYANGTFVSSSDRNLKQNFKAVDAQDVLAKVAAMPVSRWNYKNDADTDHIGPMAQDFYAAFNVGPDDKHITTVDEGGVALAAIQGLNEKVDGGSQRAQTEIESLKQENEDLKQRLANLETLVNQLAHGQQK